MYRAVLGAYTLLFAAGILGFQAAKLKVNIRRLHNTFAALMAAIVGLGLIKHTKKLMVNEKDVLAWGHFAGFAGFITLCVWILVAHNRPRRAAPAHPSPGKDSQT